MISDTEATLYDDTPLKFEEKTEMYYLDKENYEGKLLLKQYWHDTEIEKVIPKDFLYSTVQQSLDKDDYTWNITYQFSSGIRNPYISGGIYGGKRMTFRRLYIILCEKYNKGNYFIDDYFEKVYPFTMKSYVENRLQESKKALLELVDEAAKQTRVTKGNTLDLRYAVNRELTSLSDDIVQEDADYLAGLIKEDIKACLETGIIPLQFKPRDTTIKLRQELGISSIEGFYATGQLIDDLRIFFNLERKQWQTQQGIQV